MRLTPRYGGPPLLDLGGAVGDPAEPLLRQRRRLAAVLGGLDEDAWAAASRCEGWSVRDVVAHLVTTNQFWALSVGAARAGEPTRLLATFDPVATPAALVEASRSQPAAEVLAAFVDTNDALAATVAGIDGDGWSMPGEAPPGHVPLRAVALHALWDAWVHERDIVLPLGLAPVEEPDEIAGCLAYAAALGPVFALTRGTDRRGAIALEASEPDLRLVVEVGDAVAVTTGDAPAGALCLSGRAVDLVEGLSVRAPLPCPVPDGDRWLVQGLVDVFGGAS